MFNPCLVWIGQLCFSTEPWKITVVVRRSFGSRGVGNSSSDYYSTCSPPGGISFEWVGDGQSRLLLIAQAWNVLIAVVFRWTLRILITHNGVLKRNFDLHFNESMLTLFTYSAARWLKGLTVANKHINKCFGDRGKETLN